MGATIARRDDGLSVFRALTDSRLRLNSQAPSHGMDGEHRPIPAKAVCNFLDAGTRRDDPKNGRAAPGQVRLQQPRCAHPSAQLLEIVSPGTQNPLKRIPQARDVR